MDLIFVENGFRRRGEYFNCKICGKQSVRRLGTNKEYCSITCRGVGCQTGTEIECWSCKKKFIRVPSKFKARHGLNFCSRTCKEKEQSLQGTCVVIRPDHYGNGNGYRNSLTDPLLEAGCVDCGLKTKWALSLHHIDGNRQNNVTDNIECLCHVHHAKRHLKLVNGVWVYDLKFLTPRELLNTI
jgi:hypothetical protein